MRCPRRAVALIAALITLTAEALAQAIGSQEVYDRALSIGTTAAIRRQASEQPQGYSMSALLPRFERAEARPPPPPCGMAVARHYRRALRERFSVVALDTCHESQEAVDCPSEILQTGKGIFLRLKYSYRAHEEMQLRLSAFQRNPVGETTEAQVPREHKLIFAQLWDELAEMAECQK